MRLSKFLKTFNPLLCLLLSSCAQLAGNVPTKPVVDLCILDYVHGYGICNSTGGMQTVADLRYRKLAAQLNSSINHIPLDQMNKDVCFSPPHWELIQNYLDEWVSYGKSHP